LTLEEEEGDDFEGDEDTNGAEGDSDWTARDRFEDDNLRGLPR